MNNFDAKVVVLVLTCKRPFYEKRLHENKSTFDILKRIGTTLVYLYADPSLHETTVNQDQDTFNMTVPCIETYDYLTKKISLAYEYFNKTNCIGVLKIDDDTQIKSETIFAEEFLQLANKYDYFGVSEKTIPKRDGYLKYNSRALVSDPLYQNIHHKIDYNIQYYEGPFYYLSKKALRIIIKTGISLLFEDVGIGYVLTASQDIRSYLWKGMFGPHVYWNEKDRETAG